MYISQSWRPEAQDQGAGKVVSPAVVPLACDGRCLPVFSCACLSVPVLIPLIRTPGLLAEGPPV